MTGSARKLPLRAAAQLIAAGYLALPGCSVTARSKVSVSGDGEVGIARVAFVIDPTAEALLSAPPGATISDIALVRAADGQVCFDLMLRIWPGGTADFDAVVNVDSWNAARDRWHLGLCQDGSCLPSDSPLSPRRGDGLVAGVRVLGGRQCVAAPTPRAQVELFLGERGNMSIEVLFELEAREHGATAQRALSLTLAREIGQRRTSAGSRAQQVAGSPGSTAEE